MTPQQIAARLAELELDASALYYALPSEGDEHARALAELCAIRLAYTLVVRSHGQSSVYGGFDAALRENLSDRDDLTAKRAREILRGVAEEA